MLLLKWGETGFLKELAAGWGVGWGTTWADRLLRAPWPRPMPLDQGSEGHGRPGLPSPLCLPAGSTEARRNALLAAEMKALCEQAAEWALHVADKPEWRATGIQTGWLELPALHLPPVGLLNPRISLWFARPGALSCCLEKSSHRHGGYQREPGKV